MQRACFYGGVLERSKRADCKSVGYAYGGSNPSAPIRFYAGVAQLVEHWPSKPCVAGSIPVSRLLAFFRFADVAQAVERVLGKDEVTGSIPVVGST